MNSKRDPRFGFDVTANRVRALQKCATTFNEVVPLIKRNDGFYREWINLFAHSADEHTSIDVVRVEM